MAQRPRFETPWGPWEPYAPAEMTSVLRGVAAPWWIAGGYAIEAFVGGSWRLHHDVDVGVFRPDQAVVRRHLREWDVHAAEPPGQLRPWPEGEALRKGVHDVWVRSAPDEPWRFQLMLDEREGTQWVFRRDARIRREVESLTWSDGALRYLAPEVQLLYKAKAARPKDELDFAKAGPRLDRRQARWLDDALALVHPDHPWRSALREAR